MSTNTSRRCHFLTFNTNKIEQVKNVYMVAATLDAILILPTIVLNVLLIVSLYRSSEIRKPSTKLLFCLAMSDVLVGLVIEPALLAKKIAELNYDFSTYCFTGMITYVAGGALTTVSFFTLTVIAVDRYLVIHTGTKYRTIVTNTRVKLTGLIVWIFALILMTAQLYSPRSVYFQLSAFVAVLCVVLASLCYIKCFMTLRKYQRIIGSLNEPGATKLTSVFTYKKSMHTMAYVFLVFNLCYLPFVCTAVSAVILGESAAIWGAESIASVFIYGNSCINPVILFLRMKEIRKAVATTMSVHSHHGMQKGNPRCNRHQLATKGIFNHRRDPCHHTDTKDNNHDHHCDFSQHFLHCDHVEVNAAYHNNTLHHRDEDDLFGRCYHKNEHQHKCTLIQQIHSNCDQVNMEVTSDHHQDHALPGYCRHTGIDSNDDHDHHYDNLSQQIHSNCDQVDIMEVTSDHHQDHSLQQHHHQDLSHVRTESIGGQTKQIKRCCIKTIELQVQRLR